MESNEETGKLYKIEE